MRKPPGGSGAPPHNPPAAETGLQRTAEDPDAPRRETQVPEETRKTPLTWKVDQVEDFADLLRRLYAPGSNWQAARDQAEGLHRELGQVNSARRSAWPTDPSPRRVEETTDRLHSYSHQDYAFSAGLALLYEHPEWNWQSIDAKVAIELATAQSFAKAYPADAPYLVTYYQALLQRADRKAIDWRIQSSRIGQRIRWFTAMLAVFRIRATKDFLDSEGSAARVKASALDAPERPVVRGPRQPPQGATKPNPKRKKGVKK